MLYKQMGNNHGTHSTYTSDRFIRGIRYNNEDIYCTDVAALPSLMEDQRMVSNGLFRNKSCTMNKYYSFV